MKIVVAVKQVPLADQLKFDAESKRVVREGVENEINPFDKRALTQAIQLKQQLGGEVIVITMGPPQARQALIEALAMGADRAVHLLGLEFAGADSLATARALARACTRIGFDLILCGKYSTDGETAQVPPMLAEFLDLPQVTSATSLQIVPGQIALTATREIDDGFETVHSPLPALVTAGERLVKPIKVGPADLEAGRGKPIEVLGGSDLTENVQELGLAGSPTWVSEIMLVEVKRKRIIRRVDGDVDTIVREVASELVGEGIFAEPEKALHPPISLPKQDGRESAPGADTAAAHKRERSQAVWTVVELAHDRIRPVSLELLGRSVQLADQLGGQAAAVLIGHNIGRHVAELAAYGADRVYVADAPAFSTYSTDTFTAVLAQAIADHNPYAVLLPSTANGRDLAPRVAARLNLGLTGDCIGLEIDQQGRLVQLKPAFGGMFVAPILTKTRPAMATVRPGILQKAEPDNNRRPRIVLLPTDQIVESRTRVISREANVDAGIRLDDAAIIVSVGTGVGRAENLGIVQHLADVLHAPIGATRKVVDAGWLPRQVQIGLTGRSVSPQLYIAIGISGKFNHTVGIQRSRIILAINREPGAEILKQADYGIVGDWMQVVPALARALDREYHQLRAK